MLLRLLAGLSMSLLSHVALAEDSAPMFSDFPAELYTGPKAKPVLDSADAKQMRTRLQAAAEEPVNFAGRYTLVTWGCGTSCQTGAAVDAKTGKVIFLPNTICCWGNVDEPIVYQSGSRLLILKGMLDEAEPSGAHAFVLDYGAFKSLRTLPLE